MNKNDIWICKDGTKLKMWQMANSHLNNALNYFRGTTKTSGNNRLKLLEMEKKRRDKLKEIDEPIESRFEILDF